MRKPVEGTAGGFRQSQLHELEIAAGRARGEPAYLFRETLVGYADDDFGTAAHRRERKRDRQSVGDLMDLIVIEQETNTH